MKNKNHYNDNSKKLIFIGSNSAIQRLVDVCYKVGIEVAGIIDSDYYGNTDSYKGIPVIDSEKNLLSDVTKAKYYKENYNFFVATNWSPEKNSIQVRNAKKRLTLVDVVEKLSLNCISLIDPLSSISTTAHIEKNTFIGAFTVIEPNVEIEDFCFVGNSSTISHDVKIKKNSVIQRHCVVISECVLEENVYVGTNSFILKSGVTIKYGTFIQEKMYVRRHTDENEIIGRNGKNMRKVYPS